LCSGPTPSEVADRVEEIGLFYTTFLNHFGLKQYNVRYIIVGQLERAYYAADGLAKFDQCIRQILE
jgi:uncharacterized membrane protein